MSIFRRRFIVGLVFICLAVSRARSASVANLCRQYLEAYFKFYPTRATETGQHALDQQLEDFSPSARAAWLKTNRDALDQLRSIPAAGQLSLDDRLDREALQAQIESELNQLEQRHRLERDPLAWSTVVANAVVFLLVRDDLPLTERQEHARQRALQLPRLAEQAAETFRTADPRQVAPEFCKIAAGQLKASAKFYREGFAVAAGLDGDATKPIADALEKLGHDFDDLATKATGSPRLGEQYAESFRTGTRVTEPINQLLQRALDDLAAKRKEAAAYGREVWSQLLPDEKPPPDDAVLLRRLFARIALDQPPSIDDYIARWRENVNALEQLVRRKNIITLPDPRTLIVDRSPSFFVGQSVGGVFPAGPYKPDAKTILFLPMPAEDASAEGRASFFRDFNSHFNAMIVPHELMPGHYVQLKVAAHQPHKIRAIFPDPVYVEGWGTFCERLMLDQGWGGPGERLAHLKKQLENIARTIVDIRVHTQNFSRDEVVSFVKNDALQDDQFAANMWTRAITTSPQITTYYLGYRKVEEVFEAARAAKGDQFDLHRFMDGMMALGPVKLDYYLERARTLSN